MPQMLIFAARDEDRRRYSNLQARICRGKFEACPYAEDGRLTKYLALHALPVIGDKIIFARRPHLRLFTFIE